jgi:amino acid permease
MMCFSQSLGIGLFLQNGRAISYAGPALATLAYFLSGTIIWSAASSLGEMTALFPVKGPIYELPKRFLDESVGYATAWLTWYAVEPFSTIFQLSKCNQVQLDYFNLRRNRRHHPHIPIQIPSQSTRSRRLPSPNS